METPWFVIMKGVNMFKRIVELIKEALRHFVSYDTVLDTVTSPSAFVVSQEMENAIDLWKNMYRDEAPWLDDSQGVYSLGIPKQVCQSLAMQVLAEMDASVVTPGDCTECDDEAVDGVKEDNTMAGVLNALAKRSLFPKLPDVVEKGMALGGVVVKPYYTGQAIFYDFSYQGEFVPISFDDDGNIIDIAFLDQFTEDNKIFTKVERQTFDAVAKTVTVQNKAFVAKDTQEISEGRGERYQLGTEIPLKSIPRWAGISDEPVVIKSAKPLYGYYKVPLANNVDFDSPMGISVFSPAISLIKRADMQFSRLDWEFEGGQMAIDIDRNAISPEQGYYNERINLDSLKDRLYRRLDLGMDDTYNVFAPNLRDVSYINGLNRYLSKIEDAIGIARGTLNDDMPVDARTATEVRILKQRTYTTIVTNQAALQKALEDAVYAASVYAKLYKVAKSGDYSLNIEWKDSVLSDTQEELNQRIQLKNAGVLSDVELRMWYTGEDEKTAESAIQRIKDTALADAEANANVMAKTTNQDTDQNTKKTERNNDRDDANKKKQEKQNEAAKNANK